MRACWSIVPMVVLWLPGCGSRVQQGPPVFFPKPPDPPRLQVLLAFNGERDLRGRRGSVAKALFGEEQGSKRERQVVKPYGVAMRRGLLYITDTYLNSVVIVDLPARRFRQLPGANGLGAVKNPVVPEIDEAGNLYVSDTGRQQILVYDAAGKFVRALGDGESFKPAGMVVRGHRLYVTDLKENKILVLDKASGKVLKKLGEKLAWPTGLAIDRGGNFYVSEPITARVVKLSPEGRELKQYGSLGRFIGQMVRPKGLAVDGEGNLYVVDAAANHVQVFNQKGELLLVFGGRSKKPGGLLLPSHVRIVDDPDALQIMKSYVAEGFQLKYLVIVISQYGPRRITIYGFIEPG